LGFREFAQALSHFRESGQAFPDKTTIEKLWRACDKGDADVFIESIYAKPGKQVVNQFGFGKVVNNPLERSSPAVSTGPFVVSQETQVPALKALNKSRGSKCPTKPDQLAQRIRYRFCRTPVQPPSNFDTSLITLSSQRPSASIELEHVYGYTRNDNICGPNLYAAGVNGLVYAAAAVGVVHDVRRNKQKFLVGHTDDISAIAIDPSGQRAATGGLE